MFDLDASAQAMIKESREVSATLDKDQPYYFTVRTKKEKNGVRLMVKFFICDLASDVIDTPGLLLAVHSQRAEKSVTVTIIFRTISHKRLNPGLLPIATTLLQFLCAGVQ